MRMLRQVLAIAHTEFRFGLRRGAPVVTTLLIGMIFGAGILLNPLGNLASMKMEFNQNWADPAYTQRMAANGLTQEQSRRIAAETVAEMTVGSIPFAYPILLLVLFLFIPAAAAVSIPADHKFGAAELLQSLPISGGIYLSGKILGFLAVVVFIGLVPLIVFFTVLEFLLLVSFGAGVPITMPWFFLKFSLLDALPLLCFATMVGFLASLPFHSRRTAVVPGLIAGMIGYGLWMLLFRSGAASFPGNALDTVSYYLLQNYRSPMLDALVKAAGGEPFPLVGWDAPVMGISQVLLKGLLFISIAGAIFGISRLWPFWKENF